FGHEQKRSAEDPGRRLRLAVQRLPAHPADTRLPPVPADRLAHRGAQEMKTRLATRCSLLAGRAVVYSLLAFCGSTPALAAGANCDRACLRAVLDQYLNAVIKHDPAAAPLMIGFRQTENAIVVRPGTGLWKSMTGLGAMQRRYIDAVTG